MILTGTRFSSAQLSHAAINRYVTVCDQYLRGRDKSQSLELRSPLGSFVSIIGPRIVGAPSVATYGSALYSPSEAGVSCRFFDQCTSELYDFAKLSVGQGTAVW